MHTAHAVLTVAHRDFMKFLRDRPRIFASFVFPIIFIAILGGSLDANLGDVAGYDFLVFVYTGVIAQTMFQSAALGLISLIDDRDNDFSQAIFVAPISRHAIVFGKIAGEALVALAQGVGVFLFGLLLGIHLTPATALALVPVGIAVCLLGGAFGLVILVNLKQRRGAEQVFPLLLLPQIFLAGVFNPIKELPVPVAILSFLSPLRYAVDLTRAVFYRVNPAYADDYADIVLAPPALDLAVMAGIFAVCLAAGTALFVRSERNR